MSSAGIDSLSWEAFQSVANASPDLVQQSIKALQLRRQTLLNRQQQPLSNDLISFEDNAFPTSYKETRKLHSLDELYNPETLPEIIVRGDIDSVYSFDHDPVALISAHGDNPFAIPSITHASSADTGSRFCVNSERCSIPAYVRGGKVKTCPLNWFPNVRIASCQIKGLECTTMHIHLYYMGADSTVGRTNYFSHVMLGVVNAMVNMSKCAALLAEDKLSPSVRDEIMNFQNLSSKVGSQKWSGLTKGVTNVLSSNAMLFLAGFFLPTLETIASSDIDDQELSFEKSYWNGIQPENVSCDRSLSRQEMIEFAGKLRNSIVFTTSVAGCKGRFFGEDFQRTLKLDSDRIKRHMARKNGTPQVTSRTIAYNYPEDWYNDLNKLISQARTDLHSAAMQKFLEAMKRSEDDDVNVNELEDDTSRSDSSTNHNHQIFRDSPLFVDLGFTVHFSAETETFIFGSLNKNEEIIKSQMRERRRNAVPQDLAFLSTAGLNSSVLEIPPEILEGGGDNSNDLQFYLDETLDTDSEAEQEIPDEDESLDDNGSSQHGVGEAVMEQNEQNSESALYGMMMAQESIRLSKWEEFATINCIGGVHSGKIRLELYDHSQDNPSNNSPDERLPPQRRLALANSKHKICGAQHYTPFSKTIIHKADTTRYTEIASLPAILFNLMGNTSVLSNQYISVMWEKAVRHIQRLYNLYHHADLEITSNLTYNTFRYEVFVATDRKGSVEYLSDAKYVQSWLLSKSNDFMFQYRSAITEIVEPLHKTFCRTGDRNLMGNLSSSVKGMLLLCSELAVKLAGFHPFEGRIMKRIKEAILRENPGETQWHVPKIFLQQIQKGEGELCHLKFGLSTDIFSMNHVANADQLMKRPSVDDPARGIRVLPLHIQMYSSTLKIGVSHPITFMKFKMSIWRLGWHIVDIFESRKYYSREQDRIESSGSHSAPQPYVPPKRDIFTELDPGAIARCPLDLIVLLLERWAEQVVNIYDYEWFFLQRDVAFRFSQRYNKGKPTRNRIKLRFGQVAEFPTTVQEFDDFVAKVKTESSGPLDIINKATLPKTKKENREVADLKKFRALICHSLDGGMVQGKLWQQSLTRNLLLYIKLCILNISSEVGDLLTASSELALHSAVPENLASTYEKEISNLKEIKEKLSMDYFMSVVCQKFVAPWRRKDPDDDSDPIIWHTTLSNMYRVDENRVQDFSNKFYMHPISIKPSALIHHVIDPTKLKSEGWLGTTVYKMSFPFEDDDKRTKDVNYFSSSNTQLNFAKILRMRVVLGLIHYCGYYPNEFHSEWFNKYLSRASITHTTFLHEFSPTLKSYKEGFKQIQTSYKLAKYKGKSTQFVMEGLNSDFVEHSKGRAKLGDNLNIAMANMNQWKVGLSRKESKESLEEFFQSLFSYSGSDVAQVDASLQKSSDLRKDIFYWVKQGYITHLMIDMICDRFKQMNQYIKDNPNMPIPTKMTLEGPVTIGLNPVSIVDRSASRKRRQNIESSKPDSNKRQRTEDVYQSFNILHKSKNTQRWNFLG